MSQSAFNLFEGSWRSAVSLEVAPESRVCFSGGMKKPRTNETTSAIWPARQRCSCRPLRRCPLWGMDRYSSGMTSQKLEMSEAVRRAFRKQDIFPKRIYLHHLRVSLTHEYWIISHISRKPFSSGLIKVRITGIFLLLGPAGSFHALQQCAASTPSTVKLWVYKSSALMLG